MKTLRLRFKGVACAACCNTIETEMKKLRGVEDANISVMTGLVKLVIDPEAEQEIRDASKALFDRYEPSAKLIV